MSETHEPIGMTDTLRGYGGASDDELAFARSYLADGEMDETIVARLADPDHAAARAFARADRAARDWPALGHYREANAARSGQVTEVVFMGDSITEMWAIAQPDLFGPSWVNRGVSGQTSPQMLLRFMADVIALKPRAVHLMCGANDIAGNTGPTTPGDYRDNVRAMLDLAAAHGIVAVLGGITPIGALPWSPQVSSPAGRVEELNAWLDAEARTRGLVYADYHSALADPAGALRADLTRDGVHPTSRGYAVMRPIAEQALAQALAPS